MRYVNGKSFSKQRLIVQPDADLCMCIDLLVDKKTVETQDWAIRPPDHRGLRAAGPVVNKRRNDLQSPTTTSKKFNHLVVSHPQTIEYHLKEAIHV